MAYLKPQTPLKDLNSGDYFYPLTTIDQVQKSDGSRVQDYDLGNVALEDSETAPGPGTPQMTTLMNMVYPVGSIYMSVNATSPASLFGGTWESLGGRFLIGQDETYTAGSTGGEAAHTLTVNEMPTHSHTLKRQQWFSDDAVYYADTGSIYNWRSGEGKYGTTSYSYRGNTENSGGGHAHNNMPPYLAVYMWKRTA